MTTEDKPPHENKSMQEGRHINPISHGEQSDGLAKASSTTRAVTADEQSEAGTITRDERHDDHLRDNEIPPIDMSASFPKKLYHMLENDTFSKIIAWLPHGRAFRIFDHKELEDKVIPLYFRHERYSSFARQINGWGFKRLSHGPDHSKKFLLHN
jgi:hypothetical protein